MGSLKTIKAITDTCCYCGEYMDDSEKTFDHFIPLSKGGKNISNNKLISCVYCNRMKADYLPNEWLYVLGFEIRNYGKKHLIPIYKNLKNIIDKKEEAKYKFEKPKKIPINESINDKWRKSGTKLSFKKWFGKERNKEIESVKKVDIKLPLLKIEKNGVFFEYKHIGELIYPVDENTRKGDYVYYNEKTLKYVIHDSLKIHYYIPSSIQDKIIYNNTLPNGFDYRILFDKKSENFHI